MPAPDFVIVGAPKCGTTSLFNYLKQHPDIFMPERKEPHFFGSDIPDFHQKYKNLEEYSAIFNKALSSQLCGESSVLYLVSNTALDALQVYNPDVKCIAIIRSPIDHFLSWHAQNLKTLDENYRDPQQAWEAQERRKNGLDIPHGCRHPEYLQYKKFSQLGTQLENFIAKVPENRRFIILYDDLNSDTPAIYRQTLEFLGLRRCNNIDFSRYNEKSIPRFMRIEKILRHPPAFMRAAKAALKRPLNALGIHPSNFVRGLNNRPLKTSISPEFKSRLLLEFEDEIQKIENCLKRDLSSWR